jgi:transcriptional regulator
VLFTEQPCEIHIMGIYLPEAFRVDDRQTLLAHARAHPFATVVTQGKGGLLASHLPLLFEAQRNVLRGHLARANPQFGDFSAGCEALAIFHGPHAYVSPSVYGEQPSVPTWNYVVVHARGHGCLVDEQALRRTLDDMVETFDSTGWRMDAPEDYLRSALDAIAGFEISIRELEGKWKLSQNRPLDDQHRVASWLQSGDEGSRAVAALMRARLGP